MWFCNGLKYIAARADVKRFGMEQLHYSQNLRDSINKRLEGSAMETVEGVFKGIKDRFHGVTVDMRLELVEEKQFSERLEKSLKYWTDSQCRTIWFKVGINESAFVPILAKNGFNFHHAVEGFVMMMKWLPTTEQANIPPYAHTMVGVGGLVINNKNQILTISEKQAIITGSWKLPGGYVEPNENFVDAAIREVFEETGIKTKFESLVSIRHSKGFNFGCSDLYIVIALSPEAETSEEIVTCPREIAESKWMDIEEFRKHPNVHEMNRQFLETYLSYKKAGLHICCKEMVFQLFKKKYNLYYVEPKL